MARRTQQSQAEPEAIAPEPEISDEAAELLDELEQVIEDEIAAESDEAELATEDEAPEPTAESEDDSSSDEAAAMHREEVFAVYKPYLNERVRVSFEDRKMSVPGRLHVDEHDHVILTANWGLELDLTKESTSVTGLETKDIDSGRFVVRF